MTQNNIMPARRKARTERLADPREVRIGKIKIGIIVHKCNSCKMPLGGGVSLKRVHPASIAVCPDCGGSNWTATFPQKINYFRFDDDGAGHKLFGMKPILIPFTFKKHPVECVMIRRECYQGGKLFCGNCFAASESTGKYMDLHKATRQGREIDCNPETCPYSIGGNVTAPDGSSRFISSPQCGEKVTLRGWIYDIAGWEVYEFKSGSIETINNIQDAVSTITQMLKSASVYIPLKLELRLKKVQGTYPDGTGQFIKTEFYAAYIHFPHSMTAIQEGIKNRTLQLTDIAVTLPAQIFARQLPGKHEGNYDELIDGHHSKALPEPEPIAEKIADIPAWDPPTPQAAKSPADKIVQIKKILAEIGAGQSDGDKRQLRARMRNTFELDLNARKQIDYDKINDAEADRIIKWLNLLLDQRLINESKDGTLL